MHGISEVQRNLRNEAMNTHVKDIDSHRKSEFFYLIPLDGSKRIFLVRRPNNRWSVTRLVVDRALSRVGDKYGPLLLK